MKGEPLLREPETAAGRGGRPAASTRTTLVTIRACRKNGLGYRVILRVAIQDQKFGYQTIRLAPGDMVNALSIGMATGGPSKAPWINYVVETSDGARVVLPAIADERLYKLRK